MSAVIFDFDGTLVDTMPLHYEAYRRTFAEMDMELTRADFFNHIGGTARETIPRFLGGRPSVWTVEEIHQRKKLILSEILESTVPDALPVSKLLPVLEDRVPMAIASSGSRPGIMEIVRSLGWERYFSTIVTAEDASRGKPYPDLFLIAAERLQVTPSLCVVFEDTDDGVKAAITAGMKVLDVRQMVTTGDCK